MPIPTDAASVATVVANATSMPTSGDPLLETIKWLTIAIAGIVAIAAPLLMLLRKISSNNVASSKDGAESALYANLSDQLSSQKKQLDEIYMAHNTLVLEHAKTLARVSKVEEYEATIEMLNAKLSEKDSGLAAKDSELRTERSHNRELTKEIAHLKDRLAKLEMHVVESELKLARAQLESYDPVPGMTGDLPRV
jgi:chromosome segregation ATPase